jgi:pyrroloquinoline quinone (PQQ) biosynthesis protein C
LLEKIKSGKNIDEAIETTDLPAQVKQFLKFTFDIAQHAPLHVKAAVFTFGREDLIPDMFTEILNKIHGDNPGKVAIFKYYIERHIEVDGGHHSILALEMVSDLCGDDESKWEEAKQASLKSLEVRSVLWDGILLQ